MPPHLTFEERLELIRRLRDTDPLEMVEAMIEKIGTGMLDQLDAASKDGRRQFYDGIPRVKAVMPDQFEHLIENNPPGSCTP
ncbi:MAG TPA: hypothetical protein VK923_20845 [Euzebyales bacterium]|nr:hypothetical protein [Euzebyales bacterium]